jgi:hypothetical protein
LNIILQESGAASAAAAGVITNYYSTVACGVAVVVSERARRTLYVATATATPAALPAAPQINNSIRREEYQKA